MVFFAFFPALSLYADPQVSSVIRGDVRIEQNGNETLIHAGDNSIIEYSNFDIGVDERVRFIQPNADARVLNRVLSDNPSLLHGELSANGVIYLTNQAGVIVGPNAMINAAAFYAAAGWLSNDDFLHGTDHFTDMKGDVYNEGTIEAGSIYLLGEKVSNFGTLQAETGTVAMIAGDDIIIGHPLDSVSVKIENNTKQGKDEKPEAAVRQAGTVQAKRGRVMFGAGDMAAMAIHHTGTTHAREVNIDAGQKGMAKIGGEIDAENQGDNETGGAVTITGKTVEIDGAIIDASGNKGGGNIEIGGSLKGQGPLPNALRTSVSADTVIKASATETGDGGKIIIWGDMTTHFFGAIEAKGGLKKGDGGFAEISGKELVAKGAVDLSAPHGETGTLLYDPVNIEIVGGTADGDDNPDGNNNTIQGDGGADGTVGFIDTGTGADPFRIFESEIEGTNANIILEAEENITVSGDFGGDELLIQPDNNLTLRIRNDVNAGIIDLTTADEGSTLLVRTQGTGAILFDGSTSGLQTGDIRTGLLQSDTGSITLQTNNGTIFLGNDIQTDGGDVIMTGSVVLENAVTVDTELGADSAAGNVDFSGAMISRTNIANVGEAGTFLSPANGGWFTINFAKAYGNPIIVATTNTHNGQSALVPEVRNVTATTAEIRLCESEGSSGAGCDTHTPETVGYFVFDATESAALDGIEAGSFSIGGESDTTTTTINFTEAFTATPVVLALVTSDNGANRPVEARVVSRNINSFTAGICFQNSLDGCDGGHPNETVHWIAIDPANLPFAQENEAGSTGDTVSNSDWTLQNFAQPFSTTPVVIVETQTDDGTEDNEIDEARNVTTTSVEVRYCEMQSGDSCDSHTSEEVAWYAVAPGLLGTAGGILTIDATGATDGTVDLGSFDNSGGNYLLGLTVNTGTEDLILHGDITLDSPGGAALTLLGTGNVILSDNIAIDMEVGGDDNANAVSFIDHAVSADAPGFTLTLDSQGATNGNVSLGLFDNGGGAYLEGLVINNGDATLFLNEDITLDNGGAPTSFVVNSTGDIMLNNSVTIDMEAGDDEAAGLLDFSQPGVTTFATFRSGESGILTAPANGGWVTLNFSRAYTAPVVVATTNTANGNNARVAEVRNVTANSAEIRICESQGHTAPGCATHPTETVGYLVFDTADNASVAGIEAGTFVTNGTFDGAGSVNVNFAEAFGGTPLVFANVQTVTGAQFPVEARIDSVNINSFTGGICFQNSTDGCDGGKGNETVGWIAIDPNNIPFPVNAEGGTVSIGDSNWTNVNFSQPFTAPPVVLVEDQTDNGGQDVEIDEARNITINNAEIRFCELDGPDNCDTHNNDTVAWFATEAFSAEPVPTLDIDGNGSTGADIRLGAFNDDGGGFVGGLDIGTAGSGTLTFNEDVSLDTGTVPADINVTGGGRIILAANVTLDLEQGDNSAGGTVNFGNSAVSASMAGVDLVLDTGSAANAGGDIILGALDNSSGNYVNDLTLDTAGITDGFVQLGGDILLDNNGADTGDLVYNGSIIAIAANVLIDTEQGDDADGGNADFSGAAFYATAPGFDLTIETGTAQTGGTAGSINIGAFGDNAGADSFINDLLISRQADNGTLVNLSDVRLDDDGTGDTASLTVRGDIRVAADTVFDTEQNGDAAAGLIDFTNAPLSASAPGLTVTIDARGLTNAPLSLNTVDNGGGNFIDTLDLGGGTISQTGSINVSNLRLQGTGNAILNNISNNIDALAGSRTGSVEYFDSNAITIGSVLGTNGLSITGALTLTAGGNDNLLDVQQPVSVTGESTLLADKMNIAAAMNAGGTILNLRPESSTDSGDTIELGAVGDAIADALELSDAEIDLITASLVRVGDNQSGTLTVQNAVTPANAPAMALISGNTITQFAGATVSVQNLKLETTLDILMSAANDVDNLAAVAGTDLQFTDSDELNIATIDGTTGLDAGADINLAAGTNITQNAGSLIQGSGLAIDAAGNIILTENNDVDNFAAAQAFDLQFTDSDDLIIGTVAGVSGILPAVTDALIITGDDITLAQPVNVTGDVTLVTATDFINQAGATALQAGGNYLVYATSPARNTLDGLVPDFEEFSKSFPAPPVAANLLLNGFIYSTAPPSDNVFLEGLERSLPFRGAFFEVGGGFMPGSCSPGAEWVDYELCEPQVSGIILKPME